MRFRFISYAKLVYYYTRDKKNLRKLHYLYNVHKNQMSTRISVTYKNQVLNVFYNAL